MMDIKELWLVPSVDGSKIVAAKPTNGVLIEGTPGQIVFDVRDVHPAYMNLFLAAPAMYGELVQAYNLLAMITDECGQFMSPQIAEILSTMQDQFLMRIMHADKGVEATADAFVAEQKMKDARSSPQ